MLFMEGAHRCLYKSSQDDMYYNKFIKFFFSEMNMISPKGQLRFQRLIDSVGPGNVEDVQG